MKNKLFFGRFGLFRRRANNDVDIVYEASKIVSDYTARLTALLPSAQTSKNKHGRRK